MPFPAAFPEAAPFQEGDLGSIEIGITGKEGVREAIEAIRSEVGASAVSGPFESADGSWWVFSADRDMWQLGVCFIAGDPSGYGGGVAGCGTGERGTERYFLILEFDDSGVVLSYAAAYETNVARVMSAIAIQIGETSKAELQSKLGEPFVFANDTRWIYARSPAVFRRICGGGRGYLNCRNGRDDEQFLLVAFDDQGIVEDYLVHDDDGACAAATGICYSNGLAMRPGSDEADRAAKTLEPPPGQCGLYVYHRDQDALASLFFDEEWIGNLVGNRLYYHRWISSGPHEVTVHTLERSTADSSERVNRFLAECRGDEKIFLDIATAVWSDRTLIQPARSAGRNIRERHIGAYDPAFRPPENLVRSPVSWGERTPEGRLLSYESYFLQYSADFMTEDLWRTYRSQLRSLLADNRMLEIYFGMLDEFHPDFQSECRSLLAEIETE